MSSVIRLQFKQSFHDRVILYFIEDLATNPEGPIIYKASTSTTQKWGHGKAVGRNPKALEETDYGKKIKMDLMSDPRPVELRKTSEDRRTELLCVGSWTTRSPSTK